MLRAVLSFALLVLTAALAGAAEQSVEFNKDIRPILSDRCFMCHGPDATHRQMGIRYDTPDGATSVIAPGHPEQSEVLRRITATGAEQMPPQYSGKKPLTANEADLIRPGTFDRDRLRSRSSWQMFHCVDGGRREAACGQG